MAYEAPGAGVPDYFPCRYGGSRLTFRGPRARLDGPYVAALGGTATYGKFVDDPWPAQLGRRTGATVVNLGCVNAGPDAFLSDPAVLRVAAAARLRLVQVPGALNLTNPFYTVHPRRNDRFVAALPPLRALFPEVDFTEFHFTRHLCLALARRSPDRFGVVAQALRLAWTDRMLALLSAIGGPTVLVWIAAGPPPVSAGPGNEPALVDAAMIAALRPAVAEVIEVALPPHHHLPDAPMSALGLPGPEAHALVAGRLAPAVAFRH